ncbi:MAG: carboxypeptidase-like regulatory domain-containing protein [Blastocatellia bacterium]|nr:carboxypeptidase-like regulatory domain-containing protein [Blastocatellia bacterium]
MLHRLLKVVGALMLCASTLFAQNIKAALSGRVLDAQGNAVAGATLTLTELQRGQERALVTDG